jgi:hypothetical protein
VHKEKTMPYSSEQYLKMIAQAGSAVTVDDNFTGVISTTTAGVTVNGPSIENKSGFLIKSHPDNTDTVWIMPKGRTKTNGFPLQPDDILVVNVSNLNNLDFDADVNSQKFFWMKL